MGNRAFLFLALVSFIFSSQVALAGPIYSTPQPQTAPKASGKSKNKGLSKADRQDACAAFKSAPDAMMHYFKELKYVGVEFSAAGISCVNASTDGEAIAKCIDTKKGLKILNPGNPQYKLTDGVKLGDRTSNTMGFYFCFNSDYNDKRKLCEEAKYRSRYNAGVDPNDPDYVGFKWEQKSATDGDCLCNLPNSTLKSELGFEACAQSKPKSKDPAAEKEEPKSAEAELCKKKNGEYETAGEGWGYTCNCRSGNPSNSIDLNDPNAMCEKGGALNADYQPSHELKSCVDQHLKAIDECKVEAPKAKEQCSQKDIESSKQFQAQSGFVKTLSNTIIGQKTGSGSMAQCAGASILSNGLIELLRPEQDKCSESMAACKATCVAAEKKFVDVCRQHISTNSVSKTEDNKYLENLDKTHEGTLTEPIKICTKDAVNDSINLDKSIQSANEAQKSAAQCACQLSAVGAPESAGSCSNLATALECQSNPNLPGCLGPATLTCVVGSGDYASAKCECLRNPSAAICKTGADGKLPSSFPGIDLSKGPFSSTGTTFGDTGGSGSGGDMDFGSMNAEVAGNQKPGSPESAPGFSPSAGGGGGGGGGSAGGSGDGAAEEGGLADGGEKPDLGLLGQIKSSIGNLFGGGKGKNGNGSGGVAGKRRGQPDVESWRPRGLASTGCKSSQVRCKNETIWDIMHHRYDENNSTWIKKP